MTRQLFEKEVFDWDSMVLEPACGAGAISTILSEKFATVLAQDLTTGDDFLNYGGRADYVITNPPFSLAKEFILKSKEVADKFCLLLPLSYLHGKERYDTIYSDRTYGLRRVHVFTRYPMLGDVLRDDGKYRTGMMVYAWFVWERGWSTQPELSWIDNHHYVLGAREKRGTTLMQDGQ
jgi:hypothetical protein